MHIGHDLTTEYFMESDKGKNAKLEEINLEKDLGVIITNDLKPSEQCSKGKIIARYGEEKFQEA